MTSDERAEWLDLAYETAWFIHHSKPIAYLIALEVVYRWEALPPQGQRPLSKEQKFQRLVFEVSEYFERVIETISGGNEHEIEEQVQRLTVNMRHLEAPELSITSRERKYLGLLTPSASNLEDQLMMTHYVKQLALMALRHSRVKATVSLTQLLYRCSTSHTRDIYELLENCMEESGESKDLQFFAKARRELLEELKGRFLQCLRLEPRRATNGAMTYQIAASSADPEQTEHIQECLREFAPPGVRRTDRLPDVIKAKGEFIFQLFYPEQFQVTLADAGISGFPQPLFWPVFTNIRQPAAPPPPGPCPPLREKERQTAVAFLDQAAARRRQWSGKALRIMVDGREAALFDLERRDKCRLQIDAGANTIEVLGPTARGDLLLAQYLLCDEDFEPGAGASEYSTQLGGGRKIIFSIEPQPNGDGGRLYVSFQRPRALSDVVPALLISRWKLATSLAAASLAGFLGLAGGQAAMFSHTVTRNTISPPVVAAPPVSGGSDSGLSTLSVRPGPVPDPGKRRSLCAISNLFLEINGKDSHLRQKVAAETARKLLSPDLPLALVADQSKAQATLKINISWRYGVLGWMSNVMVLDAALHQQGKDGQDAVVWPAAAMGRHYEGNSEYVIDAITQDLSDAWRDDCGK